MLVPECVRGVMILRQRAANVKKNFAGITIMRAVLRYVTHALAALIGSIVHLVSIGVQLIEPAQRS
jgi:hypothetical protein